MVLDHDCIANFQRGEVSGACGEAFLHLGMPLSVSLSPPYPFFPGLILGHHSGQEPSQLPPKDDHGRAELCEWVDRVAMLEHSASVSRSMEKQVLGSMYSKACLGAILGSQTIFASQTISGSQTGCSLRSDTLCIYILKGGYRKFFLFFHKSRWA